MQCIDPYVKDEQSGQCSLDTDGDTIPDYRVSTINIHCSTKQTKKCTSIIVVQLLLETSCYECLDRTQYS